MSRYTRDELREMATQFLQAEKINDIRCIQLTLAISMKTGMHPEDVRERILGYLGVDSIV